MRASASVYPFAKSFPLILSLDIFSSLRGSYHNRSRVTQRSTSSQKLREGHHEHTERSPVPLDSSLPLLGTAEAARTKKMPWTPDSSEHLSPALSCSQAGPRFKAQPHSFTFSVWPRDCPAEGGSQQKAGEGVWGALYSRWLHNQKAQPPTGRGFWARLGPAQLQSHTRLNPWQLWCWSSLWSLQELRKTLVRACLWQKIQRSQICPWHCLMWATTHQMDSMTSRWITSITLSWPRKAVTLISPSTDEETKVHKRNLIGLPWWLSDEESACHCRRQVQSMVQEDPTYLGAAKPGNQNYWSLCAWSRCSAKPSQWEARARAPQLE